MQPAVAKSPELLAAAPDHVEPVCAANLLVLNVESLSLSDSKIRYSSDQILELILPDSNSVVGIVGHNLPATGKSPCFVNVLLCLSLETNAASIF